MVGRRLARWAAVIVVAASALCAGCRHRAAPSPPAAPVEQIAVPFALSDYPWPHAAPSYDALARRFAAPAGYRRVGLAAKSWGEWLRFLPVRPDGTPVVGVDGRVITEAAAPFLGAVLDLDVRRNQECADTITRLRAEYLRWAHREGEIAFHTGDGGQLSWPEWKRGVRPHQQGRRLRFSRTASPDASRASFDRYLASVFAWCGTLSLAQDGRAVPITEAQVGDFLVHGGSPGHAALIVDLARDDAGAVKALVLEGLMPAQSAHVLALNRDNAWFDLGPDKTISIATWGTFTGSELRRFADAAPRH